MKWLAAPMALGMIALPAQAQDAASGAAAFKRSCAMCHTVEPGKRPGLGPNLRGVVGRAAASSTPAFPYSPAMRKAPAWTPERLKAFLANPRGSVPGNRMVFMGVPRASERDDLVAWLSLQR